MKHRVLSSRFSIRLLKILVFLVATYVGLWAVTQKWGVAQLQVSKEGLPARMKLSSPAPMILKYEEWGLRQIGESEFQATLADCYSIWLPGLGMLVRPRQTKLQ
ncbi:MAG TPA: hypothetical protein P5307_03745 [Pirellulaceae bacterium]|nr:hypothetical protein [Pirellulaceae bacterium]